MKLKLGLNLALIPEITFNIAYYNLKKLKKIASKEAISIEDLIGNLLSNYLIYGQLWATMKTNSDEFRIDLNILNPAFPKIFSCLDKKPDKIKPNKKNKKITFQTTWQLQSLINFLLSDFNYSRNRKLSKSQLINTMLEYKLKEYKEV